MAFRQSWIPGLEELGMAMKGAVHNPGTEGADQSRGKAAAAVIRATNAKLAALEEECRTFKRLYEDLSDGVRKYAEAQRVEAEAVRQSDQEHREEMQSFVAGMALLRQELERAAQDSTSVRAAAAKAAAEAKAKADVAEKYRLQYEEELKRRQQLEMENLKMAREALAVPEKLRALERERDALKQTVAVLEEKCRLKEATFVDADNRASRLQSELLEWRKKTLVFETRLKEETEERVVAQRLLEIERSRKGAKDVSPLRRAASPVATAVERLTSSGERHKPPGNKQPSSYSPLNAEPSLSRVRANQRTTQHNLKPDPLQEPLETIPSEVGPAKAHLGGRSYLPSLAPGGDVSNPGGNKPAGSLPPGEKLTPESNPGTLQAEVEKAVLEALRGAEDRCDRALAAAEARGKQALAEAELDRERAVRVATSDLEARLRREFAREKRAIAESAAAEAMEAAVIAAVEEQESLHSQIEQLQATVRWYKRSVRGDSEPVRIPSGSKAHVAAVRKQTILKRVPLVARKEVKTMSGKVSEKGAVQRIFERDKGEIDEPLKQGAGGRSSRDVGVLAAENQRLTRALDECLAQRTIRDVSKASVDDGKRPWSPGGFHTQSDVEAWDSDGGFSGQSLRAEKSDTVVTGAARRASIRVGVGFTDIRSAAIRDGGTARRDGAGFIKDGGSLGRDGGKIRSLETQERQKGSRPQDGRVSLGTGRPSTIK